jgi:hypothetical protein
MTITFVSFVLNIAEKTPKPVDPQFKADVVFLVDSAYSVGTQNFETEKDFVKSFGKALNVEPGKSRAAVISYSTNPTVNFRFTDYRTRTQFERLVDSIRFLGQFRRMDKALEEADKVLNEARKDVPKVVVLLTAGRDLPGAQDIRQAVKPLQSRGAKVFIVAIGDKPDIQALSGAVEKTDDLIRIPDFSQLGDRALPLAKYVIPRAGKQYTTAPYHDISNCSFIMMCLVSGY